MRPVVRPLVLTTALLLTVAACADDDAAPTTTQASTTSTTAAVTTSAAPTTTHPPTAGDQIGALRAQFDMTPLRTTYLFGEGADQAEVTMSQDPTAVPPIEAVLLPAANTQLITTGGETIFCDTSANTCFSMPAAAGAGFSTGLLGPFAVGLFLASDLGAIPGASMTDESITIAGRSGVCFTFTPSVGSGFDTELIHQCIDSELGFTLLLQTLNTGAATVSTVMELIEFGDPLPDDFTPSGPVTATP